jgi:hypothetical protein
MEKGLERGRVGKQELQDYRGPNAERQVLVAEMRLQGK